MSARPGRRGPKAAAWLAGALALAVPAEAPASTVEHAEACDASATVFVTPGLVLVGDDEDNTLRLYEADRPGPPALRVNLDEPLGIAADDDHPEVDLEGAAWLGERIYWIGSHGRNRNGKWRANRLRFFATRIAVRDGRLGVDLVGRPSSGLLDALLADPRLRELDLTASVGRVGRNEGGALAPESGGLNIEGLSATADGRTLLIGFRNPRPGGKALLVPLTNPAEVVDSGAPPQLGAPILLDLGGLGVRSIDFCPPCRAFLLVAGPHDGGGAFVLFRWSGQAADAPVRLREITELRPEALAVAPDGRVLVLSDDGDEPHAATADQCEEDLEAGRCACKDLKDEGRRKFRGRWLESVE